MSNRALKILVVVLAVLLAAGVAAYAVSSIGTQDDPLVARSYLDRVLRPELEQELQKQLDEALRSAGASGGDFRVLTLSAGQTVVCEVGTELLPRLGTVRAAGADYPVLVDSTTGENVSNGAALSANHLYLVTIAGNGFKADGNNTKVLISGTYTVQ